MHADTSARDPGSATVTVEVSMDYPGRSISKNYLWRGGNRRGGMTQEAATWKAILAESVRMALLAFGARAFALPVTVEVRATFRNKSHATDTQNFVELIDDAVEEATGVNDRDYMTISYPPVYGGVPEVLVRVTVGVGGGSAPPAAATRNRAARTPTRRE